VNKVLRVAAKQENVEEARARVHEAVSLRVAEDESLRGPQEPVRAEEHEEGLRAPRRALREEMFASREEARWDLDSAVPRLELVCEGCGYGACVERPPDRCPMCSAAAWRRARATR
jgi:rubrerythrin